MLGKKRFLLILCCVCAVFLIGTTANAGYYIPTNAGAKLDVSQYGALSQSMFASPTCCAPVTALNSMWYLQQKFPSTYGTSIIDPSTVTPTGDHDLSGSLSYYDYVFEAMMIEAPKLATKMVVTCGQGTDVTDFINGKQQYMDALGVGSGVTNLIPQNKPDANFFVSHFTNEMPMEALLMPLNYIGTSQKGLGVPPDPNDPAATTDPWMNSSDASGLPTGLPADDPDVTGHYVNPFSFEWQDDPNGTSGVFESGEEAEFGFLDPWGGSPAEVRYVKAYLDSSGYIAFDTDTFLGTGFSHLWRIDWALVQHRIPEPGTMVLLGTGLLGLALARRRRNQ